MAYSAYSEWEAIPTWIKVFGGIFIGLFLLYTIFYLGSTAWYNGQAMAERRERQRLLKEKGKSDGGR